MLDKKDAEKSCLDFATKAAKTQTGESRRILEMLNGEDYYRDDEERPDFVKLYYLTARKLPIAPALPFSFKKKSFQIILPDGIIQKKIMGLLDPRSTYLINNSLLRELNAFTINGIQIAQVILMSKLTNLITSVTKHKTIKGVLLLHNSDIQQNHIEVKKIEYITNSFAEKNKKKILHKGDIITVHTGDVGTSAVINDEYDGSIGFTTITSRIKDTSLITPEYLCNYLNSNLCKKQIAR